MTTLPLFSMLPPTKTSLPMRCDLPIEQEKKGAIGQLATLYGVGSKADKAEENAAMAARQAALYPADRLLPMPVDIHADWTADEVEQVRTLSERLAAAEGNTTLANSWRLRLRTARGLYWMRMDARERITAGAERRADLRAGKEVDAGLVFRDAGLDQFPPRVERVAAPEPAGRRRRRTAAEGSSLSERLRAGCHVLSISWNDPSLPAPGGLERDVWGFTTPLDEDARAIMRIFAPETIPGSGWSIGMSVRPRPGPKWSEEAKGRARRRNLRARLDRKVPLFADGFYEDELQRRPDYFAGKDMGSVPVVIEATPQPDPAPLGSPLLGHNNGPPLDP